MKSTEERVIAIIAEHLGFDERGVSMSNNITDDLGADSLDAIEILMAIEEEFDLEISDEDAEKVGLVVKDIVAAVDAAINP
jgi:acyl carrier protein